jgi:hypothetical protein
MITDDNEVKGSVGIHFELSYAPVTMPGQQHYYQYEYEIYMYMSFEQQCPAIRNNYERRDTTGKRSSQEQTTITSDMISKLA